MLTKRSKILIVDDQPNIIQTLKHCFSAKGYDVNVASNGKDALGFLNKIKVDLVLLDIKMPGICVRELARIVKEKYPQAKIILISGHASPIKQSTNANMNEVDFLPQTQDSPEMKKNMLLVKTILLLAVKKLSRQQYANN
jgi:CheY-like chemotaxis protein